MPACRSTIPVPDPHHGDPVDLRDFYQRLGHHARMQPSPGRYRRIAQLTEGTPRLVTASPAPVAAFLDGIQATSVVVRREHRDVTLAYVAAGAMRADDSRRLATLSERLFTVCSHLDEAAVRAACPEMTIVGLDDEAPWDIPTSTQEVVDQTRRHLEREALDACPAEQGTVVLLDGPLPKDGIRTDVAGVIKVASQTDWILDDTLIPPRCGWRSPILRLPGSKRGERDRLSALLRLRDCTPTHTWDYSLVRVETYADAGPDLLDAVAARVLSERQSLSSPDPRATIQMASMYTTEAVLKARIPDAFSVA